MSGYRGYASPYDQAPQYHQQQRHEYGPSSYDREREREHREREIQLEISVDPNAFRRYYNHHLQQLGFNSKPIITNLTMIASQHLGRMSSIVAQCLEDHLRTCPPEYTLPCLYLLDSISKNIGPPYTILFARFIERSFLSIYHEMDPVTKIKMEELLGTWRTGGQDGGELFKLPGDGMRGKVQNGIEGVLFGNGGRGGGVGNGGRGILEAESFNSGVQQVSIATPVERSAILFDVRRLLNTRREQAFLQPLDSVNNSQIQALTQLESLVVSTQLSAVQVKQIRSQLATLTASLPPTLSPPPAAPLPPPVIVPLPVALPPSPIAPKIDLSPTISSAILPVDALAGIDLSLLAQLAKSGSLSNLFSATPSNSSPTELLDSWDKDLLALSLTLTNSSITKSLPTAASFLFDRLSLQCKQCGLRGFNCDFGQGVMDVHLDWHFVYKRRIREGGNRAQGRSWFSPVEEWIKSDSMTDIDPSVTSPKKSTALGLTESEKIELGKKKVLVNGSAIGEVNCSICKEVLKSEFDEDEEDWVYFNAVQNGDIIYHATCQAELSAIKKSKLKLDPDSNSSRPSRESTPLALALKNKVVIKEITPERKRKAEESELEEEVGKRSKLEEEVVIKVENNVVE